MNVLITGSSGQIGTNLALALLDRGDSVLGIDIRDNTWTSRIETVRLDLVRTAPAELPRHRPFDVVVHLAANAKVFALVENPEGAMDNITMLFNVLEYCRLRRLPLVFSSSREVYGDIHRHVTHEEIGRAHV